MIYRALILAIVLLIIDYYVFQAVKVVTAGKALAVQRTVQYAFWAISLFSIACVAASGFIDVQLWPKTFRTFAFAFIVILYFAKLFVVLFLIIDDLARMFRWLLSYVITGDNAVAGRSISRSKFLSVLGLIVAAIPFTSLLYGIVMGPYRFKVVRKKLKFARLPAAFDGLRVLQISDIHIGSWNHTDHVDEAAKMIAECKPDVVFFTGDLVNNVADETNDFMEALSAIKAPMGVYSILGNHDYGDYVQWPSAQAKADNLARLKAVHGKLGWNLLLNQHAMLSRDNEIIAVMGVENWSNKARFPKYGKLDEAHAGLSKDRFKILLSHDPSHWEAEVLPKYDDIDLTLSGHTHGFQFGVDIPGFKWSPVQYVYKQWAGLYRNASQMLYVNRGLGFIGYPGRVGIMPELTLFELSREA